MNIKILISIPLFLFPAFTFSQDYSTWGEIYDYEIGDVFHFEECEYYAQGGFFEKIINTEITDKIFSPNQDTIFYTKFNQIYTVSNWLPNGYSSYYETIIYTNLDSIFNADSIYYSTSYNGRKISYQDLSLGLWEEYVKYVDGCGLVFRFYRDMQSSPYDGWSILIYFKKGDEEWGTPNVVTNIGENLNAYGYIKVFPNPATDKLSITLNNHMQIKQVLIYNNNGKLVFDQSNSLNNINISNLSPGLYIVKIIGDDWTENRKLIVE